MPQYGMVIDLQRCVGCGACAIACKTENNTPDRAHGQTHNWADYLYRTNGTFPHVRAVTIPVMCNHCTDAPCVAACPTTPKAMHKHANGATIHDEALCIGCQTCQAACPYSAQDVDKEGAAYSVISFNTGEPHGRYRDTTPALTAATSSGAEVAMRAGSTPPYRTRWVHSDYRDVRRKAVVEKCNFCEHRVVNGEPPYCVVACPAGARIFGDLQDPASEVSKLLKQYPSVRLKNNKGEVLKAGEDGTRPNVHYIRSYKAGARTA